jgi:hypothetical protein
VRVPGHPRSSLEAEQRGKVEVDDHEIWDFEHWCGQTGSTWFSLHVINLWFF